MWLPRFYVILKKNHIAIIRKQRWKNIINQCLLPAMNPAKPSENGFRPDITIQTCSSAPEGLLRPPDAISVRP